MLFDTDIIIWVQRGNPGAALIIDTAAERSISIITYMELLQCAGNKKQHSFIKDFLKEFDFLTLPLSENIGHRASIYIEEYTLASGLRTGDALIAATAIEHDMELATGNARHFKMFSDLKLKKFKP